MGKIGPRQRWKRTRLSPAPVSNPVQGRRGALQAGSSSRLANVLGMGREKKVSDLFFFFFFITEQGRGLVSGVLALSPLRKEQQPRWGSFYQKLGESW